MGAGVSILEFTYRFHIRDSEIDMGLPSLCRCGPGKGALTQRGNKAPQPHARCTPPVPLRSQHSKRFKGPVLGVTHVLIACWQTTDVTSYITNIALTSRINFFGQKQLISPTIFL